jgi:phosphatidylglycerol:prolipoprotein diacylglycerol transferase
MLLYLQYPSWLRPEIFSGLPLRWYSLMYIVAFGIAYWFFKKQHKAQPFLSKELMENMFFSIILGLLLGARLFYVLIYNFDLFLTRPWMVFWPFDGGQFVGIQGLSYHGGVIGAVLALIIYCRKHQLSFLKFADLWAAAIPFGYTFGRLGNFANAELYGRATTAPWGMIFPYAKTFSTQLSWVRQMAQEVGISISQLTSVNLPRHPSQLYEAFFEGIVLGLVLWFIVRKKHTTPGAVIASYVGGYGFVRFFIEYLREPDEHLGYIIAWGPGADTPGVFVSWLNFSMGQILCLIMMVGAAGWFAYLKVRAKKNANA